MNPIEKDIKFFYDVDDETDSLTSVPVIFFPVWRS